MSNLKIVELRAENIKNLKAVEIRPDGDAVVLTGKNGAGKSAVLDSIFMALTGKKVEEPIRKGEERAEVIVDLDKYIVKKVFTAKGERLEVKSRDGALYPTPQTLLNTIIGALSFDPLEFMEMKEDAQRDLILELAGVNLKKFREKRQEVFDNRTSVNRTIKNLGGTLATMKNPPAGATGDVVNTSEIIDEISSLTEKRSEYLEAVKQKEERDGRITAIRETIERLTAELEKLEAEDIPIPVEVTNDEIVKAKMGLAAAEETNRTAYDVKKYRDTEADLEVAVKEADRLTNELKALDELKDQKIKETKFPIDSLSVTDEAVTYRGVPIYRLSTGEQIRVSTAIAMSMNPTLRVIFVKEGSLLDGEGMDEILKLTKNGDYQLWIEKVADTDEVGFFIEDGQIAAVDGVRKQ